MATIEESILNGNTSGTIRIPNYATEFDTLIQAINLLKGSVDSLTAALGTNMLGVTASTTPGTIAASAKGAAVALQAIAGIDIDGNKKQAQGLAALGSIAKQLAGLSSTLAAGVATNQIIAADQIKKNAFDKQATQAALKRNKLPEVTVTPQGFLQNIQTSVQDAGSIAAQASATGFVTSTASSALGVASTYIVDGIPSFGQITDFFKGLNFGTLADKEGGVVRTNGSALNSTSKATTGTA
jgi:hypothetical protein